MPFVETVLIGFGLSADAFAVSVTNGLSLRNITRKQALKIAAMFGAFQAVMPLLGFLFGTIFKQFINSFAHYVALIFLGFIGIKMIIDGLRKESETKKIPDSLPLWSLIVQAVATSIDALVAGVSFVAMGIRGLWILPVVALIGTITFSLSFFGVGIGRKFGGFLGNRARIAGGVILIGIGLKVFFERL
ncbi:MAG: manganese efflux pump MntP family protein [Oscillospiraceae bacterium]|jgi:putative Mn2+ efflux pump MntP|nr:manganese efflux pump MntP family protein [Oscillospiraceae bacterium]